METTKNIQHLLFRTMDGLTREQLADPVAVRDLLTRTALQQVPFLYAAICRHIDTLLDEFCAGPCAAEPDAPEE